MVVPLAARCVAAAFGALLVLTVWSSVIGTLIVPRPVRSWLTRWVDWTVDRMYWLLVRFVSDVRQRDRVLATEASVVLLAQLAAWVGLAYAGFMLLLWPCVPEGLGPAAIAAGSSMFTLGFEQPVTGPPLAIVFIAAATGLIIVALQIGYLPALYGAFNRRETEVALLNARGGFPSWGPELLARTHYGLGTGVSTIDTLPDLYERWERWAADVAESHTTYLPLVRFRSTRSLSSWVTALLAVLDSAAMLLALCPETAPVIPARLCLRAGFQCFNDIGRAMGIDLPMQPDPDGTTSLGYADFLAAIDVLREVDFPIERDPAEAWPDFTGWRVNYERAAHGIAYAVDAVPALWSGPRRDGRSPISPVRPPLGRQNLKGKPRRGYSAGLPAGQSPDGKPAAD